MRRLWLFGRARALRIALLLVLFCGGLALLLARLKVFVPGWGQRVDLETPLLLLIPVLTASVIGGTISHPFGELEPTASYPVRRLRASYLLGMLTLSGVLLVVTTSNTVLAQARWIMLRNLLGFTGLAALSAVCLTQRFAWLFPLAFFWLARLNGLVVYENQVVWANWAWPFQPANQLLAWAQAASLAMIGLGWLIWREPQIARDPTGLEVS